MPHKLLLVKDHIGHKVIFAATLSYLLGVRILSVSSISHLFHAIERQSQADKKQQAANERRHHAQRQRRASLWESEATVWLHPTPAGSFLVPRRAGREGRSQSTCRKRTPRRKKKKKEKREKKKASEHPCGVHVCSCDPSRLCKKSKGPMTVSSSVVVLRPILQMGT